MNKQTAFKIFLKTKILALVAILVCSHDGLANGLEVKPDDSNKHKRLATSDHHRNYDTDFFERVVVRVITAKQNPDFDSPWLAKDNILEKYHGTMLSDDFILTLATACTFAKSIEIQNFNSTQKRSVQIYFKDNDANLCLLTTGPINTSQEAEKKWNFSENPTKTELAPALPESTKLFGLVDKGTNRLNRFDVTIADVSMLRNSASPLPLPNYILKGFQRNLGLGEPVFRDRQLVGIVQGQDENQIYALTSTVIKHFLADSLDHNYRGFPSLMVETTPLSSPHQKKYLKLPEGSQGIRVAQSYYGPASETISQLKKDDIILSVSGIKLDDSGSYSHDDWGTIGYENIISERYAGEQFSVLVWRDGREVNLQIQLNRLAGDDFLIPWSVTSTDANEKNLNNEQNPDHLIIGGLIFQELTRDYLREWGRDWMANAPPAFLYSWTDKNFLNPEATRSEQSKFVFLNRVLADEYNMGYEFLQNSQLASLNGVAIKSLTHLRDELSKVLADNSTPFSTFVFSPASERVVLDNKNLAAVHKRLIAKYKIHNTSGFLDAMIAKDSRTKNQSEKISH